MSKLLVSPAHNPDGGVISSLCELSDDGAGSGVGHWGAFSDYRRGTSRAAMARDIYYCGLYVSGAGDCRLGGAGAVGIAGRQWQTPTADQH
jgi:hypothetical protein